MARIRTVKPALFRHHDLYKAEKETKLPLRLAWIGLFTVCDREGRFKWRPEEIKPDVLPFDKDVNFEHVMVALATRGFIQKYELDGKVYGFIPTWKEHQVINAREALSSIPSPTSARVTEMHVHAHEMHVHAHGEGKGKGREKEEEGNKEKEHASPSAPVCVFDFESIYKKYPRKLGKASGIKALHKQIKCQSDFDSLQRAVENYAQAVSGTEEKYIKHFSSFVGTEKTGQPWREYVEYAPRVEHANKAEAQSAGNVDALKAYLTRKGITT